ncbi:MAG: peptidoglycan-binding protein [Bauldia sp.]
MKLNYLGGAAALLALGLASAPAIAQVDPAAPGAPAPALPEAAELTAEQVTELQTLLTQLGYDTQGIDGVVGPATRAAIEAAQQALGLPVDGEATLELLDRLRTAATAAPAAPAAASPAPVPGLAPLPVPGG